MRTVTALTTDGGDTGLKAEALEALAGRLRGPLLTPELHGYDEARQVWNGMIDRRPAVIGRCVGMADVKACVEFAREQNLLVSVKGGGHNIAGKGVWDGGNFGIVTSFEYQLHPVGPLLAGPVFHPYAAAADVLHFYQQYVQDIPDEVVTGGVLLHNPDGVPVVGIIGVYNGPLDTGEQVLRPAREFGQPVVDEIQPMPYPVIQAALDAAFLPGGRYYLKGHLMVDVTDEAIAILLDHYRRVPSPGSLIVLQQIGNAANRVDPDATAFSYRHARYDLVIASVWADPADDEKNIRWARELHDAIEPYSLRAVYVNSVGDEDVAAGVRASYRPETLARLAGLKAKYDPTNFLRLNPNILPAG